MNPKELYFVSERVQHQGGVVADVMANSIATSAYSQAETFLREVLQNACDQKIANEPLDFIVEATAIAGAQKEYLNHLLASARKGKDPLSLSELEYADSIETLIVADAGTQGLVGPLDASLDISPSNFAGFFFNVGRATSESKSGGSFGLGRTVLTNASDYSTILVYSQFQGNRGKSCRFMGMAISNSFSHKERKFTGRHWFGAPPKGHEGLVNPIEGRTAEAHAKHLGLKEYLGDKSGFVAMVLGNALVENPDIPHLAEEQRKRSLLDIQEASYLYGWPHMLGPKRNRSVNFSFRLDGKEVPMEDPKKKPAIKDFILCYESLTNPVDGIAHRDVIFSDVNGKRPTGTLAWRHLPCTKADLDYAKKGLIPLSSIALMRQANFVVKYMEVAQSADEIATRGVFKSNEDFDAKFRKSEPVAHDDWIPTKLQLKPGSRNPIRQTLDNIKETFRALGGSIKENQDGSPSVLIGNMVGRLLDGLTLTGSLKQRLATGNSSSTGSPNGMGVRVVPMGSSRVKISTKDHYEADFKFQVIVPKSLGTRARILFSSAAILENGSPELQPPIGVTLPFVRRIMVEDLEHDPHTPIEIDPSLDRKVISVTISSPQGVGCTCKTMIVGDNA